MSESSNKIIALQQNFKLKLPEKIEEIETLWLELQSKAPRDFSELYIKLHSLVGTSGTYSAVVVSTLARKIEDIIKSLMSGEIEFTERVVTNISSYIADLHKVSNKWQPSEVPYIPENENKTHKDNNSWNKHVYLVEDDVDIVYPLIELLESEGYKVFYYSDVKQFEEVYFKHEKASAVIMDMAFKQGHVAGAETIKRLSEKDENFPPVIFISVHNDVEARLAAAQAGAKRYFTKPLNHDDLLSSLNNLTNRSVITPYKILLIDDEQEILDYYSTILKEHNFNIAAFTDPFEGYKAIESYGPDLILIDLYMTACSGLDLAKIIRQNDLYAQLPIVFLSAELDPVTQLAAMDLGGDDFLVKPVQPDYFLQAVTSRVKRHRRINKLNKDLKKSLIESKYRLVTLNQHAVVSMADKYGKIVYVNEKFSNLCGYGEKELIGNDFTCTGSKKYRDYTSNDMWEEISAGKIWRGQVCNLNKKQEEFWLELTIVPFLDENGEPYKYISAGTDITKVKNSEIKAHEDEMLLLRAKEESEKANSMKTEFLGNMSHELRTPLNAISGFTQLLLMDAEENLSLEQKENLREIEKASSHLLLLISELLNLSQIEAGKMTVDYEEVSYSATVINCIKLVHSLIERKGINIVYENEGEIIGQDDFEKLELNLYVDPMRFKQVLLNILNNALNYNRENGTVTISSDKTIDSRLRISITDTGEGISEENLKHIFVSHNRLGKENTDIEGTGLGLVITKKLTNAMGGETGVRSEVGVGTTFWLEFPLVELDLMRI